MAKLRRATCGKHIEGGWRRVGQTDQVVHVTCPSPAAPLKRPLAPKSKVR
jgi:hypothetical protein